MAAQDHRLLLAPEEEADEIIVSKKKLDQLLREKDAEIERLRQETKELRRRLSVHENPHVPPSIRNHSPGFARERSLVPVSERQKPGPKPGHAGCTRAPLPPDRRVTLQADRCGRCQGRRLRRTGSDTKTQVELPPPRTAVVIEFTIPIYECLDCGQETRGTLPEGRAPSGYGPQLQAEVVLGKIYERLPYRRLAERLAREGAPMSTATLQGLVWATSQQLGEEYAAIRRRVRRSAVVHADETGFSVDGRKWWLWTFATPGGDTLLGTAAEPRSRGRRGDSREGVLRDHRLRRVDGLPGLLAAAVLGASVAGGEGRGGEGPRGERAGGGTLRALRDPHEGARGGGGTEGSRWTGTARGW